MKQSDLGKSLDPNAGPDSGSAILSTLDPGWTQRSIGGHLPFLKLIRQKNWEGVSRSPPPPPYKGVRETRSLAVGLFLAPAATPWCCYQASIFDHGYPLPPHVATNSQLSVQKLAESGSEIDEEAEE
jgi:hypothetical protein